ncbi:hypothetical protein QUB47_23915 [Microcoleus sp. AT9_B5]
MVKETFTLVKRAGDRPSTYNLNGVQLLTKYGSVNAKKTDRATIGTRN